MERIIKSVSGDLKISEPEMYVDNEARGRSGHMSHAMTEYQPGKVLDFNSNCSSKRLGGHAAYGWIEYRRSLDSGRTWGDVYELPYAKQAFLDGKFTVSIEKAVTCPDGTVVIFGVRNDPLTEVCCEPWDTPVYLSSPDAGETWTDAQELSPFKGRVYDAVCHEGVIYAYEFCNTNFLGSLPENVYRLYKSEDSCKTFTEVSIVDIETEGRGYGAIQFRPDGSLLAYAYNSQDECHMDTSVSYDLGKTWKKLPAGYVAKGIRNPQIALLEDTYILHGRGADFKGFVFYTSKDGVNWDDGYMLESEKSMCYYSNNLVLEGDNGKKRLLVQYSDVYKEACVNVMHLWLEFAD